MRTLAYLALLLLALAGCVGGGLAFYVGWQIQTVVNVAEPAPTQATLVDLLEKAPGRNLHVELSGFTFGKPIIEKTGETWSGVWVPLHRTPPAGNASGRAAFFRLTRIQNQAQLDDFLKQHTLKALVTNPLPRGSLLKVGPNTELKKAYPELDMNKVAFLTAAESPFRDYVLDGDTLLNPGTAQTAWAVSGGFFFLGVLAFGFLSRMEAKGRKVIRRATCAVEECTLAGTTTKKTSSCIPPAAIPEEDLARDRDRLTHESPRFIHELKRLGFIGKIVQLLAGAVIAPLFGVVLLVGSLWCLERGYPGAAAFGGFFILGCLGLTVASVKWLVDWCLQRVSVIQVCPSGLRWSRRGSIRQATWGEILRVERLESETYQTPLVGMGGLIAAATAMAPRKLLRRSDEITIELRDETLHWDDATLTDYAHFVDSVQSSHGSEAKRLEFPGFPSSLDRGLPAIWLT